MKAAPIEPAFLACLGLETLQGLPSFGAGLRHLPQLVRGAEPTDLAFAGIHASPLCTWSRLVRFNGTPRSPRLQTPDERSHACANEMVLQTSSFKPEAGSGEV
jgi:hypothetical protein